MPSKYDPADCLEDIVENAGRIAGYVDGMSQAAFEADGRTRDAVERCLERICEAAHRLGTRAPDFMAEQNWRDMRGMGNWLRHGYDRVDSKIIWHAVRHDLPGLEAAARRTLEQLPKDAKHDQRPPA